MMNVMDVRQLKERLPQTAFAFRGYNVTNLGRSAELLAHSMYGPHVRKCLLDASHVCADLVGRRVNLVARVTRQQATTLKTYAEAMALIVAMERAHIELLREFYGIELRQAKFALGFSLGEIAAVAACGVINFDDALRIPIQLAEDCVALAAGVTLCVLFSRGEPFSVDSVHKLCLMINQEGHGVIGISACLSPNTMLLMGQGDTVDRFQERMHDVLPKKTNLRKNAGHFPPLHTPITWQRNIPDRVAVLMQTIQGGFTAPQPPILSLVTGTASYNEFNARQILHEWVDHPQLLWDVVYETLTKGIETMVHVGPEPNIIPATYKRLRDNVETETKGSIGMRALKAVVHRPWIQALLPERSALLRAPSVQHVILEDWLLQQPS